MVSFKEQREAAMSLDTVWAMRKRRPMAGYRRENHPCTSRVSAECQFLPPPPSCLEVLEKVTELCFHITPRCPEELKATIAE